MVVLKLMIKTMQSTIFAVDWRQRSRIPLKTLYAQSSWHSYRTYLTVEHTP